LSLKPFMNSAESPSVNPTSQPVDIATHTTIHVNGVTEGGRCCCVIAVLLAMLLQMQCNCWCCWLTILDAVARHLPSVA
jgi:hypothetical protein